MENFVMIQSKDLEAMQEKIDEIHQFILRESIKPARRLKEEWLSSNEAAQVLRCSIRTIHNYVNQGLLPHRKYKRRMYFLAEDLEQFLVGKWGYNPNKLALSKLYEK